MGIYSNVKQKFSSQSLRLVSIYNPSPSPIPTTSLQRLKARLQLLIASKKIAPPTEGTRTDYDIDTSPPYSPTPSAMERPSLHPQVIFDLRQACAIIVNETNPPDPDEEPDHQETLRKAEERNAKYVAQGRAVDAKVATKSQKSTARNEDRTEVRIKQKARKAEARKAEAEARAVIAGKAAARMEGPRKVETQKSDPRRAEPREAESPEEQARKEQPKRYSSRRPKEDITLFGPISSQYTHVPKHAASSHKVTTTNKRHSQARSTTIEPKEPTYATILSENARGKRKEIESPVARNINANLDERPKTSAAACVDYDGPPGGSSKSTTRSNTEYDNHPRPTSTAVTSISRTPLEDRRPSYNRRPSDESYQSEEASAQAKAWMEHKLAIKRAGQYANSGRAARHGSRISRRSKKSKMDGDSDFGRPLSRAGSFAGSIADSIGNYIRPRPSTDSVRSGWSSSSNVSGSHSRRSSGSRRNSGGWWRGAGLRRNGSWSSFRSAKPDNEESPNTRKNGEPNLNRPLPALPGLDTYKETKTHIGQLMKAGARGRSEKKDAAPYYQMQPQPQPQPQPPVEKSQISAPIIDQAAIDTTLSRFGGALVARSPSLSQTRQERERNASRSESRQETQRQASTSETGQEAPQNAPVPTKPRSDSTSNATSPKIHNIPPIIRGPSYHKEVQTGVYPRPMEVATGVIYKQAVEASVYPRPMEVAPNPTCLNGMAASSVAILGLPENMDAGQWEKKGGLKGKVGRIFGGGKSQGRVGVVN
ncbi:hypothetical protein MMC28_000448 [Mycoblastus sanguinarius]|nr:hypothetical protein [Mycoblastus sanguinarius]